MIKVKKEKKIQSRSWQLIIPAGWDNLELIKERCKSISRNYYFVLHNYDTNELSEPVKPHWHLLLSFATSRELNTMQNYFKDYGNFDKTDKDKKDIEENKENEQKLKPNSFERVYSINGAKKYLVHAEDPQKFQYNPQDVETNDSHFIDLFLPSPDKISNTKRITENFRKLNECKTFAEFLDLFQEQFFTMSNHQQISNTIALRRYYNDYHSNLGTAHNDGFEPVYRNSDGFIVTKEEYDEQFKIDLENFPF